MAAALLLLATLAGLLLLPFGLPGLWVIVGAMLLYSYTVPGAVGLPTIVVVAALALVAEVLDCVLTGRIVRHYGGSRRAGWGAILGGLVGAFVGVPVPLIGSVVGAFIGAFAGGFLAEMSRGTALGGATRVATGALLGQVVAMAMKVAIGMVLAVVVVFTVWS